MRILLLIFVFGLVSCSTSNEQGKKEAVGEPESIIEPIKEVEEGKWTEIDGSFFADVTYFLSSTSEFYIPMSFIFTSFLPIMALFILDA